ncbi:bifunctional enzyme CysN/CysC [Sphingomonas kaistensis]|uniref:Adenylyl-sulfate kinase n=1 Tax=Sphingomonas kaistensis TaxID=298708 RepID=A0A7X5Y556_9SPHN|nr:adenylyl-sulfate kinase [Sphingomonas kaistensis]NJC04923.1 bifunctional enzyme CysN/CysC [Sphingomonas kaistensis]
MDLLRFITCGSVDDGKSTLIGRLLHDSAQLMDDQIAALESDSRRMGTQGQAIDFALLVDGLAAEREQGITIDVAYRFFSSATRRFIVADCPGHEQYTRNMATGASTADAAVLLVDARKGVLTQTRRHAAICRLMGVRHLILAVNKMDLVGFDAERFEAIAAEGEALGAALAIPLSGLTGANVFSRSAEMPWFAGPTLMEALDAVPAQTAEGDAPLRLPVQWVNRPHQDFRGYAGLIAAGSVVRGQDVRVLPSGRTSRVASVLVGEREVERAEAGQSVTLTLTDEVDCSRGSVIVALHQAPEVSDQFEASLVWLAEEELLPGRGYWLHCASQSVTATVQPPKYELGIDTGEHLAARTLGLNAIGVVEFATDRPLVFEPYATSRALGGFILVDKVTNATVACGMIHFALRRASNIHWQAIEVSRDAHARQKAQKPCVIWLTGLSGAGKSTIANRVEQKLHALGRHSFLLDGDNVRHGLSRDLGFTEADRIENIRRVGEVARLMADAGLIVITAFISPFRAEREMVRRMLPEGEFLEVFVDAPLAEAERRDVKGLYAKARAGKLSNFTGIDSPYEAPERPDLHIDTTVTSADEAAERIVDRLLR